MSSVKFKIEPEFNSQVSDFAVAIRDKYLPTNIEEVRKNLSTPFIRTLAIPSYIIMPDGTKKCISTVDWTTTWINHYKEYMHDPSDETVNILINFVIRHKYIETCIQYRMPQQTYEMYMRLLYSVHNI